MAAVASGGNQPPRRPPARGRDFPLDAPDIDVENAVAEYIRQFRERWREFLRITATARSSQSGILAVLSDFQQSNFVNTHMLIDNAFNPIPLNIEGDRLHQDVVHHWRLRNRIVRGITTSQFGEVERHTMIINTTYHDLLRDLLLAEPVPNSNNEWYITRRPFHIAQIQRRYVATAAQRRDNGLANPGSKRVIFDPYGGVADNSFAPSNGVDNMLRGINDEGIEYEYTVSIDFRHLVVAVKNTELRLPCHFEGTCNTSHGGEVEYLHRDHEFIMLELALLVLRHSRESIIMWDNAWVIEPLEPENRTVTCGTWVNPRKRTIMRTPEFQKLNAVEKENHLARFRAQMFTETRVVDLFFPDQIRMYQDAVANILAPFQQIFSTYYQLFRTYQAARDRYRRGGRPFRFPPSGTSYTVDDAKPPSKKKDQEKRRKSD